VGLPIWCFLLCISRHNPDIVFFMKLIAALISLFLIIPAYAEPVLPQGFSLKPFAYIPNVRTMAGAPELGVIFAGTRDSSIYAVIDKNQDAQAEDVRLLHSDLNVPNGLAWKDGYLYVTEQHRLTRYNVGDKLPEKWPEPEVLYDGLPDKRWHGWRYSTFGPDGALYVSVGAPCNICWPRNLEGTILRFDPQTWMPTIFARGVRNSVGLDFNPITNELFFTDNGADNMGDDIPPDELNHAPRAGLHFGYPYFGGGQSRTSDFTEETPPFNQRPVQTYQAHVAPLGIEFYTGGRFPDHYKNGLFVNQHGSWNRSIPVGYRVSFHPVDAQGNIGKEEDFLSGFLSHDRHVSARPVDLEEWADGRMLISDDYEGIIYLLDYQE